MRAFALSEPVIVGMFGIAIAMVGGTATVLVALLTRESRRQNRAAEATVVEFEEAWEDRGKLIDGFRHDLDNALTRLTLMEGRELDCLEALQESQHRIAVLEARLEVDAGE